MILDAILKKISSIRDKFNNANKELRKQLKSAIDKKKISIDKKIRLNTIKKEDQISRYKLKIKETEKKQKQIAKQKIIKENKKIKDLAKKKKEEIKKEINRIKNIIKNYRKKIKYYRDKIENSKEKQTKERIAGNVTEVIIDADVYVYNSD